MDELKINSKFMRSIVSKLIEVVIKKRIGYKVKVDLNDLNVTVIDGQAHIHLSGDADMDKADLTKLVKSISIYEEGL